MSAALVVISTVRYWTVAWLTCMAFTAKQELFSFYFAPLIVSYSQGIVPYYCLMLRVPGKRILIGLEKVVERSLGLSARNWVFSFKKIWCHEGLQRMTRCHKLWLGWMVGGLIFFMYSFCKMAVKGFLHVRKYCQEKSSLGDDNFLDRWHFKDYSWILKQL